jgi:polyphosphate:AMP phosphotransferase
MWRFWRRLPPRGKVGVFLGSWYSQPMLGRVFRKLDEAELVGRLDEILRFEQMLIAEGALVLKLWLHLTEEQQARRLKKLEKDSATRWRVTKRDWEHARLYSRFRKAAETVLRQTSSSHAPWLVVSGEDARYRELTVAGAVYEAIAERLAAPQPHAPGEAAPMPMLRAIDNLHILRSLDLSLNLPRADYLRQLEALQNRLGRLSRDPRFAQMSVLMVFEGNDAAGKGSSIRRVTSALDPRFYRVVPIAAPTDEERAHPYLWRFWRHLPKRGHVTLFDRSWYGRVLVERVENFCTREDWGRAYAEINDFESQLAAHHILVFKFWLAISKEEQLHRFEERQKVPFKRYKITEEDWRNRDKWEAYEIAVCDMVERTSTDHAPWTLVEANDKLHARVKILKTICKRIEAALDAIR